MVLNCNLQVHKGLQPVKSIWRDRLDLAVFDEPEEFFEREVEKLQMLR